MFEKIVNECQHGYRLISELENESWTLSAYQILATEECGVNVVRAVPIRCLELVN